MSTKDETKDETKNKSKNESKNENESNDENKSKDKTKEKKIDETKYVTKEETKKQEDEIKGYISEYINLVKKVFCFQLTFIIIILLIYSIYYGSHDYIIYFVISVFLSMNLSYIFFILYKLNDAFSNKYYKKTDYNIIINIIKYFKINILHKKFYHIFDIIKHIINTVIILCFLKFIFKKIIITKYSLIKSVVLLIIYIFVMHYITDGFKNYKRHYLLNDNDTYYFYGSISTLYMFFISGFYLYVNK